MKELEGIIKYLDNEVIGEEKQAFEQKLLKDSTFKEKVELVREIDSAIADQDYIAYRGKLQDVCTEFSQNNDEINDKGDESVPHPKFAIRWQYLSVAAVGLVFVISTIFYKNITEPSNEKLFKEYYSRYEANVLTRSETSDNNDLITAIQLYDRGSYAEAIVNFKSILKSDASNTAAHFFLGVSYMETNNYKSAIENLSYVITQNDTVFVEHAEWYMAMCYLKTNQSKLANQILTKISTTKNFYKLMAADLLKKMK